MLVPLWLLCPAVNPISGPLPELLQGAYFPLFEATVHLFSLTDSAFSLQWSGSHSPGRPLWGLLCPPSLSAGGSTEVSRGRGQHLPSPGAWWAASPLTLAPKRYVLKELWRESFAKLSEVPKSCRKLGKRWSVDLRVACGDLKLKA